MKLNLFFQNEITTEIDVKAGWTWKLRRCCLNFSYARYLQS